MKKRNFIAKDLLSKKFSQKKVRPKKGKGSYKRKKLKSRTNLLNNFG